MGRNSMNPMDSSRLYITCLAAVLFWEFFSTISLEWRFIWKPIFKRNDLEIKRTRGTGAIALFSFVIVRYLTLAVFSTQVAGLFMDWSTEKCGTVIAFQSYSAALVITAATALLGVRVAAVWAWDRRILACLALIFTLQAVCLFYSAAGVRVCLEVPYCAGGSSNPAVLFLYWVSPMICDLLLVILTISRAVNLRKRKIKLGTASLIIKAGIFYCAGMFFCNLMSASLDLRNDSEAKPITATLALMGTSVLCCRTSFSMAKHSFKLAESLASSKDGLREPSTSREKSTNILSVEEGKGSSPAWSVDEFKMKTEAEDWRERRLRISVQEDSPVRVENPTSLFRKSIRSSSSRSLHQDYKNDSEARSPRPDSIASSNSHSNSLRSITERPSFHSSHSNRSRQDVVNQSVSNSKRISSTSTLDLYNQASEEARMEMEMVQSEDARFAPLERSRSDSVYDERFARPLGGSGRELFSTYKSGDRDGKRTKHYRPQTAPTSSPNTTSSSPIRDIRDERRLKTSGSISSIRSHARNQSGSSSLPLQLVIHEPSSSSSSLERTNSSSNTWFGSSDMNPSSSFNPSRKHQRNESSGF